MKIGIEMNDDVAVFRYPPTYPDLVDEFDSLLEKRDVGALSYVRKLVTELSGGVFGYLDSVLERHSFDEFGELI